jgi:hypothetical protein
MTRIQGDDAICGSGLAVYAISEVVYASVDCDIQEINFMFLFFFSGELQRCGVIKVIGDNMEIGDSRIVN